MIKDIELIQTDTGGYDWNFTVDDLVVARNNNRIRSAVVHAVMLKPYELENNEYATAGNTAHEYVLEKNTEHVNDLIKDGIKSAVEEIAGISDATVEVTSNNTSISVNIIVLKNNGEEVAIDGISI